MTDATPTRDDLTNEDLAAIVIDLAVQVEQLKAGIGAADGERDQVVETLLTTVEGLIESVNDLRDDMTAKSWPEHHLQLHEWVTSWLLVTFPHYKSVLADWENRPSTVSELAAAFAGYKHMVSTKANPFDALTWHSMMASTMDRIREHDRQANTTVAASTLSSLFPPHAERSG